jgi:hypothetical protein
MSIELSSRLPDGLDGATLKHHVERKLRDEFAVLRIDWSDEHGEIDVASWSVRASVGAESDVLLLCVPPTYLHGERWLETSVVLRTPESKLLTLLIAASVAELADAKVLDEAGWTGFGFAFGPRDVQAACTWSAPFSALASELFSGP